MNGHREPVIRVDGGWIARLPGPPPHPERQEAASVGPQDPKLRELLQADYEHQLRQLPMPGWWPILDRLHDQLASLDPDYEFGQVKEKLGRLRVYVKISPGVRREAARVVRAAEAGSAETCERCGDRGELRADRRWKLTLCDDCDTALPDGRHL